MEPEGYTILLGLVRDKKISIVRREDGFERRVLSRCVRCNLVVGYEIVEGGPHTRHKRRLFHLLKDEQEGEACAITIKH